MSRNHKGNDKRFVVSDREMERALRLNRYSGKRTNKQSHREEESDEEDGCHQWKQQRELEDDGELDYDPHATIPIPNIDDYPPSAREYYKHLRNQIPRQSAGDEKINEGETKEEVDGKNDIVDDLAPDEKMGDMLARMQLDAADHVSLLSDEEKQARFIIMTHKSQQVSNCQLELERRNPFAWSTRLLACALAAQEEIDNRNHQLVERFDAVRRFFLFHEAGSIGSRRYADVLQAFTTINDRDGKSLTEDQEIIAHAILVSAAPGIHKSDWEAVSEKFYQELGIAFVALVLFACLARRRGKTHICAKVIAAIMVIVVSYKILVFSQNGRTSCRVLDEVVRCILLFTRNESTNFGHESGAKITFVPESIVNQFKTKREKMKTDFCSSCECLPMTVQGNRGVGANFILLDEASFAKAELIYKVILPLLMMLYAVLVAISTPDKSSNYFSQLLRLRKKDNTRMVKTIYPMPPVCEEHKRLGKASECDCFDNIPHFHSAEARELQKAIMPAEVFDSENRAMIIEEGSHLYAPEMLDALFDEKVTTRVLPKNGKIDVIFVGVDPTAGSPTKACLGLVAICLNQDGFPVVRYFNFTVS